MEPVMIVAGAAAVTSLAAGLFKRYRESEAMRMKNKYAIKILDASGHVIASSEGSLNQLKHTTEQLISQVAKPE